MLENRDKRLERGVYPKGSKKRKGWKLARFAPSNLQPSTFNRLIVSSQNLEGIVVAGGFDTAAGQHRCLLNHQILRSYECRINNYKVPHNGMRQAVFITNSLYSPPSGVGVASPLPGSGVWVGSGCPPTMLISST
jgi:hypothetical protein